MDLTTAFLYPFNPQLKSWIFTPVTSLVTKLNNFEGKRLFNGSRRVFFHPETKSHPSSNLKTRFFISDGSSWRSASIVMIYSPVAILKPSLSAADFP